MSQNIPPIPTLSQYTVFSKDKLVFSYPTPFTSAEVFGNVLASNVVNFPPGRILGTLNQDPVTIQNASNELDLLINYIVSQPAATKITQPLFLNNAILMPGVYESSVDLYLEGSLTLNGNNDPNAIFIIRTPQLTLLKNSYITIENGANPRNIFWLTNSVNIFEGAYANLGMVISPTIILGTPTNEITRPEEIPFFIPSQVRGYLMGTTTDIVNGVIIDPNYVDPGGDSEPVPPPPVKPVPDFIDYPLIYNVIYFDILFSTNPSLTKNNKIFRTLYKIIKYSIWYFYNALLFFKNIINQNTMDQAVTNFVLKLDAAIVSLKKYKKYRTAEKIENEKKEFLCKVKKLQTTTISNEQRNEATKKLYKYYTKIIDYTNKFLEILMESKSDKLIAQTIISKYLIDFNIFHSEVLYYL